MAYFPIVENENAGNPTTQAVYDEIKAELGFGMVPNLFKSMATKPEILRANWDKFRATILHGEVPRTLKEMIGVAVSQHNDSPYARAVHLHGLSALGTSDEVLQTLTDDFENCPLPERKKEVIRFGFKAATDPHGVREADYDRLRELGLSDEEIFELVATADLFSGVNRYTDSIDLEIDEL